MPGGGASLFVLAACASVFAVCYLYARHVPLSLLAAAAPLPGMLVGLAWHANPLPAYGFGACVAGFCVAHLMQSRLDGEKMPLAMMLLAAWGGVLAMFMTDWRLGAAFAATALGAVLLPPLFGLMPFGEDAIARANRARERRALLLEAWSAIAVAPWALALTGAGLALAVVALFRHAGAAGGIDAIAIALLSAALLVILRDWRAVAAALAAGGWLLLFAPGLPVLVFLVLALTLGMRMSALPRALEQGGPLLLAGVAGLTAFSWAALAGLAAALLLFPALLGSLERLFPSRRNLEDLYGA